MQLIGCQEVANMAIAIFGRFQRRLRMIAVAADCVVIVWAGLVKSRVNKGHTYGNITHQ